MNIFIDFRYFYEKQNEKGKYTNGKYYKIIYFLNFDLNIAF